MENIDFNWILLGVTFILTGFITFVRVMDYFKHKKMVLEFHKNEKDVVLLLEDKKNIYLYMGMSVLIFAVSLFLGTTLIERLMMAFVFTTLILTELLNAMMTSHLYASSKSFLYGVEIQKIRSIKSFEAKGKQTMKILFLNKTDMTLPKAYALSLQNYLKSLKDAKKS